MSDTELLQDEDLLRLAQMRGGGGGMRDVSDAAFEPAGADAPPVEAPGGAALPETAPEQSGSSEVSCTRVAARLALHCRRIRPNWN